MLLWCVSMCLALGAAWASVSDLSLLRREVDESSPYMGSLWGAQKIAQGEPSYRQTIAKSDTLPKYCDPPNPCPSVLVEEGLEQGLTEDEVAARYGCRIDIEDTLEFNQRWIAEAQENGECACDREHMRGCPIGGSTVASGDEHLTPGLTREELKAKAFASEEGEDDEDEAEVEQDESSDEDPQDLLLETEPSVSAKKRPANSFDEHSFRARP